MGRGFEGQGRGLSGKATENEKRQEAGRQMEKKEGQIPKERDRMYLEEEERD